MSKKTFWWVVAAAAAFEFGDVAWIHWQFGGAGATQVYSDLAGLATSVPAGVACIWAAKRTAGRERRGWMLVGLGCLSWGVGELVWTWYELVLSVDVPFPSVADYGFLGLIPLAVLGVLAFSPASRRVSVSRDLADAFIMAGSFLFVGWAFVLGPAVRAANGDLLTDALSLAYPGGDVLLIAVALYVISRAAPGGRGPYVLVAAGLVALGLADSGFTYLTLNDAYVTGNPIDVAWNLGFLFVGLGAARRLVKGGSQLAAAEATPGVLGIHLPHIAVLVAAGAAAVRQGVDGALEPFLFWTAVAIVVALVARHMLAIVELTALARDFESKVEDRTRELAAREERFRALVANSTDAVLIVDAGRRVLYASDSAERVLGRGAAELVGRPLAQAVHPEDRARLVTLCTDVATRSGAAAKIEYRFRYGSGSWRHLESTVKNLADEPSISGLVLNTRDVTERRRLEGVLTHRAFHDALTDLPNRALFIDRVEQAISRTARRGTPVTVLYLDLDGFKVVNDSFGHATGDRLLRATAERLRRLVRSEDTVARFGGDEFAVLLDDDAGPEEATRLADRVLAACEEPVVVDGREFFVRASIGIATTSGAEDAGELLRDADVAMYRAKAEGRGQWRAFDPLMREAVADRLELEAELRRALDARELFLEYQPIVDLASGRISGVEALMRWHHPTRGLIPPLDFVPVAEENGQIVALGAWALAEACRELRNWQISLGAAAPSRVSVNVSARQFRDPGFVDQVAGTLRATGLDAGSLVLEITETLLMEDPDEVAQRLHRLKDLGVILAVDDFGIGYSSLSYLQRFPIDVLKIDRLFVQPLGGPPEDAALAQAIVKLGRTFGMDVVAEGVETAAQAAALRAMGCQFGQGFLFARTLPPEEIEQRIRETVLVSGFR
ncbi:MAG: EAL domain-containing protein [Actinobacteria bacterium]|nr:EAL domain-containing protein [Actinomycetota bacterium]